MQCRRYHNHGILLLLLLSIVAVFVLSPTSSLFASGVSAAADAEETESSSSTEDMVCEATEDGGNTCTKNDSDDAVDDVVPAMPPKQKQPEQTAKAQFINQSKYRVDVHWDDGRFGSRLGDLAVTSDGSAKFTVDTYVGHSFFVTKHGTRELLYHPKTHEPLRFTVKTPSPGINGYIIPKKAELSDDPCQDRFSICQAEAERGGCWQSPGWMIVHCCQSCDKDLESSKLIDSTVRCTKERLNITEPAWYPGDLHKLFTKWATDPQYESLQPHVWSSPEPSKYGLEGSIEDGSPWVITFDNFLSDDEVEDLIEGGRLSGFERSTDQGAMNPQTGEREKVVSTTRTSSNAWCSQSECESLPGVRSATKRIEDVTGIPQKNYESYQILEYDLNQFYRMHHDSSPGKDKTLAGHRILTFFLYLSDVEVGGETRFNKLGMDVAPKKGRALVWPSVLDDDPTQSDLRMYHEARPVIEGKKYAANHWIHLNDYRGPNVWGCTGSFS